jgi:hypothetical protein
MLETILGAGAPRTAPARPWPELASTRAAVDGLIRAWDDDLADELFADNLDLDEPRESLRAHVHAIVQQLGQIDESADLHVEVVSPADLDWTITGSLRSARVELGLTPEPSPRIQTFEIALIPPDPITGDSDADAESDDAPFV